MERKLPCGCVVGCCWRSFHRGWPLHKCRHSQQQPQQRGQHTKRRTSCNLLEQEPNLERRPRRTLRNPACAGSAPCVTAGSLHTVTVATPGTPLDPAICFSKALRVVEDGATEADVSDATGGEAARQPRVRRAVATWITACLRCSRTPECKTPTSFGAELRAPTALRKEPQPSLTFAWICMLWTSCVTQLDQVAWQLCQCADLSAQAVQKVLRARQSELLRQRHRSLFWQFW